MTEPYDRAVASHYAAYRPPLHPLILRRAPLGHQTFPVGLDVGCGTGRSSVALADICEQVCAIDPSESMIEAATRHRAIAYHVGSAERMPIADDSVDIVTFAGSLSYACVDATTSELIRTCRPGALIMPYDFEVSMDEYLQHFAISVSESDMSYDHAANFSKAGAFTEICVQRDLIEFDATPTQIAHLLLSDHDRHAFLAARFNTTTPHRDVTKKIEASDSSFKLRAEIFYSVYRHDSAD